MEQTNNLMICERIKQHPLSKWSVISLITSVVSFLAASGLLFITILAVINLAWVGAEGEGQFSFIGDLCMFLYIISMILFFTNIALSVITLIKKDIDKSSKQTSKTCLIISLIICLYFSGTIIMTNI